MFHNLKCTYLYCYLDAKCNRRSSFLAKSPLRHRLSFSPHEHRPCVGYILLSLDLSRLWGLLGVEASAQPTFQKKTRP